MFDANIEKNKIIEFIRDYFDKNNLGGVVIGISGGKDSGVVAGLFSEAIGPDKVLGVWMPCKSREEDYIDAKRVSDKFGFNLITFDLNKIYDSFKDEMELLGEFTEDEVRNSDINVKPRLRMTTLYYLAALYSAVNQVTYVVAGTGNKCETYVGYYTKGGDNVSDINVLGDLCVEEVIQIGEVIGVPKEVLYKSPNDGLSGITDEEKLGVKYSDITKVINREYVSKDTLEKIENLHKKNLHKLKPVVYER